MTFNLIILLLLSTIGVASLIFFFFKFKFTNIFSDQFNQHIICFSFVYLFLFKIYRFLFLKPTFIETSLLIFLSLFITFFFLKELKLFIDKIKETYIFILMLYFYFDYKEKCFNILVRIWESIKKQKLFVVFLTVFIIFTWVWKFIFFFTGLIPKLNDFCVNLIEFLLFLPLLILAVFNFIEKKLIFSRTNYEILQKKELDFILVKSFLKIQNKSFNKNVKLYYIQRRYLNLNFKEFFKKGGEYLSVALTSAGVATALEHFWSYQSRVLEKERNSIDREKNHLEGLNILSNLQQHDDELDLKKLELKNKRLMQINSEINRLEEQQSQSWTADYSKIIKNLERERNRIEKETPIEISKEKVELHNSISELLERIKDD